MMMIVSSHERSLLCLGETWSQQPVDALNGRSTSPKTRRSCVFRREANCCEQSYPLHYLHPPRAFKPGKAA